MALPRPLPFLEHLALVGYRDTYAESDAAGVDGICEVSFDVPADETWLVDRLAVTNTSTAITQAAVYVGTADPRNFRADTDNGNKDVAEGTPIVVQSSRPLLVHWTGADAGAVGTAVLEYRVMAHQGSFGR
jgi:hypothetical protein